MDWLVIWSSWKISYCFPQKKKGKERIHSVVDKRGLIATHYFLLAMVKLRMLSSKISHTDILHPDFFVSSCVFIRDGTAARDLGVTGGVTGSTSTTRNTALPSSTRCTLSWSQLLGE